MYYPRIVYQNPTVRTGAATELRPIITIDWSNDMDQTYFTDAAKFTRYFGLQNEATSDPVGLTFVSYTVSTKRLLLTPSADLARGTVFRVLVKPGVRDNEGRGSERPFTWTFETDAGGLSTLSLLAPADITVWETFPTLSWTPLTYSGTGTVSYKTLIDDDYDFSNPIYTGTTTASSIAPGGIFDESVTYYWKVLPYTEVASGQWSEVRSFYYGTIRDAHESSRTEWVAAASFAVSKLGWRNGATHLTAHPTLRITFTSQPASDYADHIEVISMNQLPRNDQAATYDETTVAGSWTRSGNALTFTPTSAIAENTRYEIRIANSLANTDGVEIDEDIRFYWCGRYSPIYVHPRVVIGMLRTETGTIEEDLIYYNIFLASLEAKAMYYNHFTGTVFIGDTMKEATVRDSADLNSHGLLRWVAARSLYNIASSILMDQLRLVGSARQLGDFREALSRDFIEAIREAKKQAEEEMEIWERFIVSDRPLSVPRAGKFMPEWYRSDLSLPNRMADRWRMD